jgi:hypothetical protein
MSDRIHFPQTARRPGGITRRSAKAGCLGALACALLIASFGPSAPSALAASTTPVVNGRADSGGNRSTLARPHLKVWLSAASYRAVRGRRLQMPFLVSGAAKVTLTVLRGKKVVATRSITRRKVGRSWLSWDVKINHRLAPTGDYKIMLRAVSPAGASAHAAATAHVEHRSHQLTDPRTCTCEPAGATNNAA